MGKIKKFIWGMSISARLRIVFLPILIGSIFLITFVANNITKKMIIENASQDVEHYLELISTNVSTLLKEANSCSDAIIINIDSYMQFDEVSNRDLNDVQNITLALKKSKILFDRIDGATYVNSEGDYITEIFSKDIAPVGNIQKYDIFEEINNMNTQSGWLSTNKNDALSANPDEYYVTYIKEIRRISTLEDLGHIVLNIHENHFYEIFKSIDPVSEMSYKIIDEKGVIISSSIRKEIASKIDNNKLLNNTNGNQLLINNQMMLINSTTIENADWKLISLIPVEELTKDVDKMTKTLMMIGGTVFFVALLITIKFSQTITSPLTQLTNHMKNLKDGNLSKCYVSNRGDEIGILNESFNNMINRNQKLLQEKDQNEKKKREYEFALLQSQIKPHFLYNTLDIIYRLASLDRKNEVLKATKNIADFYRIALSKGDEIIPLKREIQLVEKYLYIQRIRYPDVFDFIVDLPEEVNDYSIPKFTLQPLVENAIYHGLKAKKKKGHIEIKGTINNDEIILKVIDNGIGMDEEQISKIFSKSTDMTLTKSYGIINIDERLKLYYGEGYGIQLISEPSLGTTVLVKLRTNKKEDDYVQSLNC